MRTTLDIDDELLKGLLEGSRVRSDPVCHAGAAAAVGL